MRNINRSLKHTVYRCRANHETSPYEIASSVLQKLSSDVRESKDMGYPEA